MLKKIIKNLDENGFYIQNILSGPLVICDPPNVKDGLQLDPLQPGQIEDLSYYAPEVLGRSLALNTAIKKGYVAILSEEEYLEQVELEEKRLEEENLEIQRRIVEAEASGNVFEAEQINILSSGDPHRHYEAEALLAQKNTINHPDVWAAEYRAAKEKGLVKTPQDFANMVESGRISLANSRSDNGRRISLNEIPQDQISMTSTKATVGVPVNSSYNNGNERIEKGEIMAVKRNLVNFNTLGDIQRNTGADASGINNPAYNNHSQNVRQAEFKEDYVEEIDIAQDDAAYEASKYHYNNQVAHSNNKQAQIKRVSPYIGRQ